MIAFNSSSSLYIADQGDHRVQAWNVGDSLGTTVAGQPNGVSGSTSISLNQPSGVYVDSSNNVYVADTNNHRIQLWTYGALSGTTVAGTGSSGSALNQLNSPQGLSFGSNSTILYIADTSNHRIMSYASGAYNGTVVAGGNGQGTLTNQLSNPCAVYFDSSSNSLLIANSGAHTIVRWVIGSSGWTLVAGVAGNYGSTTWMLSYPQGLTLDSTGNIYVADSGNHRVQLFLSGQKNGTTIAGVTSASGSLSNLLSYPHSLLLDQQLNLYVSDSSNHRIQMFVRY
ncbi:unnamed protein product [Rotaria sp. Silwood1]|nr:unnamed protein product [Rotaria sp. Silwood1]